MRRICPKCELPLWEDATASERDERRFCSSLRCSAWEKVCSRCTTPIRPGQLYIPRPGLARHVACPTPQEIAHRKRMGRL